MKSSSLFKFWLLWINAVLSSFMFVWIAIIGYFFVKLIFPIQVICAMVLFKKKKKKKTNPEVLSWKLLVWNSTRVCALIFQASIYLSAPNWMCYTIFWYMSLAPWIQKCSKCCSRGMMGNWDVKLSHQSSGGGQLCSLWYTRGSLFLWLVT